jgi:epoxyqueuosine reductase
LEPTALVVGVRIIEHENEKMKTSLVREIIEKHLVPRQDFIYGFADLTHIIDKSFGDFQFGISIGKRLDDKIVNGIYSGPTLDYYQHYRQVNIELAELSHGICADLKAIGVETVFLEPTVTTAELDTIYSEKLRTNLSHKMVATRAGLGWIGKSDLFVSKAFGPRLRLVSILTNFPLDCIEPPIEGSRCGTCTICMNSCPAEAINGKLWDISVDRDEFFDAFKCREKCKEFGEKYVKMNVRVCGICVAVCPFGW